MGVVDLTIGDVIQKNRSLYPEKVGFVEGKSRWTFAQYAEKVEQVASALFSLGVIKGDRIGVLAFNSMDYLTLYGAAAHMGAVVVPVNWRLKPFEAKQILQGCSPKAIFLGAEFTDTMAQMVRDSLDSEHRVVMGGKGAPGFVPFSDLYAEGLTETRGSVTRDDPLIIIHTAAVAGKPKGAVLSHGNLIASAMQAMAVMDLGPDDIHLNLLPYFHIGGLGMAIRVMHSGGRNVIMKRFDAAEAAQLVQAEQATVIEIFPPMLVKLLDEAAASGIDLSTLNTVSGLDHPDTIRRCQSMTGARFWVGFGQTETTGFCTLCPFDERPGSAGKEGPLARVILVGDNSDAVSREQIGEILVKGPLVFTSYWNKPEETAHTLRDGWHHTGDMGRLDELGYLWYAGRKAEKDLIKPGGENVYPAEVEKVLLEHPDILEAMVIGIPDREWGEAVQGICVRKTGSSLKSEDLISFVADRIARYKRPKSIIFVDALPKSADGAVDRTQVKDMFGSQQEEAGETP